MRRQRALVGLAAISLAGGLPVAAAGSAAAAPAISATAAVSSAPSGLATDLGGVCGTVLGFGTGAAGLAKGAVGKAAGWVGVGVAAGCLVKDFNDYAESQPKQYDAVVRDNDNCRINSSNGSRWCPGR